MPVVENIQYFDTRISGTFAASANGKLVYLEGNQNDQSLVLLDKNGNQIKRISDLKPRNIADFSPDGKKIMCDLYDPNEKKTDI